jgi:hypothetical protein
VHQGRRHRVDRGTGGLPTTEGDHRCKATHDVFSMSSGGG